MAAALRLEPERHRQHIAAAENVGGDRAGLPATLVNRSGSLPAFCTARITAISS
jgi:hypothetical protein